MDYEFVFEWIMEKLIILPAEDLLNKFGAGNHKPGSGSAAAFQGLLAAQLILTVIELTDDVKRRRFYEHWLPEMHRIAQEINQRIYPQLKYLFQKDSEQFDRTIQLRKARDEESNELRKRELTINALQELMPATELPVEIAELCIELAEFGAYIFDHGFKSARGDASVAQNGAISAIGGCLSIINLNLLSFGQDKWTEQIRQRSGTIKAAYDILLQESTTRIEVLNKESERNSKFHFELQKLLSGLSDERNLNYTEIEIVAGKLQNLMWLYKDIIWKRKLPEEPLDVLRPELMLKQLGYLFYQPDTLGQHETNGEFYEVAGLIDKENKVVQISKQFPQETQNFTLAHELGHALFHKQTILHRDKAIDGSGLRVQRDFRELQADKFAACFLMPQKQVKAVFEKLFSMKKFTVTENSVFALTNGSVSAFRKEFATKRDVCRFLSSIALAEIFSVSVETMAIRLEELNLVEV